MGTQFTVIQFVPNPVADERLNAGVIVYDDTRICVRFTKKWKRLQSFGAADVEFLKSFAADIERFAAEDLNAGPLSVERLEGMIAEWSHLIQFTTPRGSLLDPDTLLDQIAQRFLPTEAARKARTTKSGTIKKHARDALKVSIRQRFGKDSHFKVENRIPIHGRTGEHTFDIGVLNSAPRMAAEALTMPDAQDERHLQKIHATAWAMRDVRDVAGGTSPRLSVLIDDDDVRSPAFDQARRIFDDLGVEIIEENHVKDWADKVVGDLADET
jgi:hypothetical protein